MLDEPCSASGILVFLLLFFFNRDLLLRILMSEVFSGVGGKVFGSNWKLFLVLVLYIYIH